MSTEVRFKQRFQNFEKAYLVFEKTANLIDEGKFAELEQAGLADLKETLEAGVVQQFEVLVELSWKVMCDYLLEQGVSAKKNPTDTIRHAFQNELIEDGEKWMAVIDKRNQTSHTYDGKVLEDILQFATEEFYPLVRDLYIHLNKK